MNRNAWITLIVVVAALLVGGILYAASNDTDKEPTTEVTQTTTTTETTTEDVTEDVTDNDATATKEVGIEDMAFSPASITVKKGTTVTWTNRDAVQHTVTPDNPSSEFTSSSMLSNDESYSVTFNTVGSFTYHCQPHPQMTGTVIVTE
jgi:amicyanin